MYRLLQRSLLVFIRRPFNFFGMKFPLFISISVLTVLRYLLFPRGYLHFTLLSIFLFYLDNVDFENVPETDNILYYEYVTIPMNSVILVDAAWVNTGVIGW